MWTCCNCAFPYVKRVCNARIAEYGVSRGGKMGGSVGLGNMAKWVTQNAFCLTLCYISYITDWKYLTFVQKLIISLIIVFFELLILKVVCIQNTQWDTFNL